MPTFRSIISDIVNDVNSVNRDDRFSYRYLANKLRDAAKLFLKQDSDMRKIFKMYQLWKSVNCVELEDVDILQCPWYLKDCHTIKRSKIKIPKTYETSYGNAVVVSTLKNERNFKQIKAVEYSENAVNKFAKGYLFWIEDDYLYIPDSSISFVKIYGIFTDTTEVDKLNGVNSCLSPLDLEFSFPEYIISLAKKEVLKELMGTNKQIIPDNKGDLNTTTRQ